MQWNVIGPAAALHRTKSIGDVSFRMLFQFSAGVFLWILYGIYLQDFIIVVANLVTFVSLILAISLYFYTT